VTSVQDQRDLESAHVAAASVRHLEVNAVNLLLTPAKCMPLSNASSRDDCYRGHINLLATNAGCTDITSAACALGQGEFATTHASRCAHVQGGKNPLRTNVDSISLCNSSAGVLAGAVRLLQKS